LLSLLLKKGQLSATDISNQFHITPAAISQHLKVLREASLLEMEKKAQLRLYKINPNKMKELEEWIKKLSDLWDKRFSALDRLLEKEKKRKGGVK
jgi:DNA-binding transcriptional ArsR family regulator